MNALSNLKRLCTNDFKVNDSQGWYIYQEHKKLLTYIMYAQCFCMNQFFHVLDLVYFRNIPKSVSQFLQL